MTLYMGLKHLSLFTEWILVYTSVSVEIQAVNHIIVDGKQLCFADSTTRQLKSAHVDAYFDIWL